MIPVTHDYKICCVKIKGHEFMVDLIPIQLGEFNVILGMDWLSKHGLLLTVCKSV